MGVSRSPKDNLPANAGGNLQLQAVCKMMQTVHKIDAIGCGAKAERSARSGRE